MFPEYEVKATSAREDKTSSHPPCAPPLPLFARQLRRDQREPEPATAAAADLSLPPLRHSTGRWSSCAAKGFSPLVPDVVDGCSDDGKGGCIPNGAPAKVGLTRVKKLRSFKIPSSLVFVIRLPSPYAS